MMLELVAAATLLLSTASAQPFPTNLNHTLMYNAPIGGAWDLGPTPQASWHINNPDSWFATITATSLNSTFSFGAQAHSMLVNVTAASTPANASCFVQGSIQTYWVNTTITEDMVNWVLDLGPRAPNPDYMTYTCHVDRGVTVTALMVLTGLQSEVKSMDQVYVAVQPFATYGGPPLPSMADEANLPLSDLHLFNRLMVTEHWEPVIHKQPPQVVLPFTFANYTALRGNGTLWYPIPANTSEIRIDGTTGANVTDSVITIVPTPPTCNNKTRIYAGLNVTDQWSPLYFRVLDPTVLYNIKIEPLVSGGFIEVAAMAMASGLRDVSNWPLQRFGPGNPTGKTEPSETSSSPTTPSTSAEGSVPTDLGAANRKAGLNAAAIGGGVGGAAAVGLLALFGFWRYHLKRLAGNRPTSFAVDDPAHRDVGDDAPPLTPFDISAHNFPRTPMGSDSGSLDMHASHLPLPTRDREKHGSRSSMPSGLRLVGTVPADGRDIPSTLQPASPVMHELDGGEYPQVLPPMYSHEWGNASNISTFASSNSTADGVDASTDLASPAPSDIVTPTAAVGPLSGGLVSSAGSSQNHANFRRGHEEVLDMARAAGSTSHGH
ncbi:hypothetical protein Q8F55_004800 [Vanrija albida]|uniref:Peptidase A1 domain-containing protein n=1 Tax=Vanrija albida TaxID=181172 RepID=A0ABR3Q0U1_9TREE